MLQKQLLLVLLLLWQIGQAQNVGIGTTTPDASAQLDISSTGKGLLIPRLSAAQRDAIASPAKGLLVFVTTDSSFYYYDGAWQAVGRTANTWGLQGNAGTNPVTQFLGTTDAKPMQIRLKNFASGWWNADQQNYFLGLGSGRGPGGTPYAGLSGQFNTAIGGYALSALSTGSFNNAIGNEALVNNTTGGTNNAFGSNALRQNRDGYNNTAIGDYSQAFNTRGFNNTSAGAISLVNNKTGNLLLALGYAADVGYDTLTNATAIGANARVNCSNCLVLGPVANPVDAIQSVNVGIGISKPLAPLNFAQDLRNRKIVLWGGPDNDHQFLGFGVNAGALRYQVGNPNDDHVFYSGIDANSSRELVRFTGDGKVGIGTNDPQQKLHVQGNLHVKDSLAIGLTAPQAVLDVKGTALFRGANDNSFAGPMLANTEFFSGRTGGGTLPFNATLTDLAFNFAGEGGGFRHFVSTRHDDQIQNGTNAIDFYLNNSSTAGGSSAPGTGNLLALSMTTKGIGIGTSSPNAPLQLSNAVQNRKLVLWDNTNDNHHFNGFGINPFVLRYQINTTNDAHVFYAGADNAAASVELMRITGNGKVGIGTPSPAEALDVNGNTAVSGNLSIGGTLTVASVAQDAVQAPTLQNLWVNNGGAFANAGYYRDKEKRVHLQGVIKNGVAVNGVVLFNLPAGYRPAARQMFAVENAGVHGRVDVLANGDVVYVNGGGSSFLSLSGISFRVD